MNTKEYKAEDIRFSWRLISAPAIGQLIGLMFGYIVILDPSKFLSAWIGGATGTCIGFWYGVYWHFSDTNRRKKKPYFTMIFLGIICNGIGVGAFTTLLSGAGFSNNLDKLKAIRKAQITKITIMENFDNVPLLVIDDGNILSEFAPACQDAKKYIPKANYNPKISFSCFLDFSKSFPYGLSVDIFEGENNRVICTFAKRYGKSISYYGTFESNSLRPWFDDNIVSKIKKKT